MRIHNINMLRAAHGDSFILSCTKNGKSGNVIVDGGAYSNRRFNEFIGEIENYQEIDLMIVTHPDDDHICGILDYVRRHKNDNPFPVKEILANFAPLIPCKCDGNLSARQGATLADLLEEICDTNLLKWRQQVTFPLNVEYPFCDILFLTPDVDSYENFMEKYRGKILGYHGKQVVEDASPRSDRDYSVALPDLAHRKKRVPSDKTYDKAANIASVSFILRCDDFSILMLGDTYPQNVCRSLRALGYSEEKPLEVDYVKVAHHGSASNISNELLGLIRCNRFLFSTNGGKGKARHPERETIANILCHPMRDYDITVHLYFNYKKWEIEGDKPHLFNPDIDDEVYLNYKAYYGE